MHKDSIAKNMREFSGGSQVDSEELKKLKVLLRNYDSIMQLLTEEVAQPNFEGLGDWATQMVNLYNELAEDEFLAGLHTEAAEAGAVLAESQPDLDFEAFIINYLNEKMLEYAQQIQNTLEDGNVKFILAGFLQTKKGKRPIKLSDDFDELPEEVYSVPRWDTSLSEDDKKELKEIAGFINNIKKLSDIDEGKIKEVLLKSFQADECLRKLNSELKTLIDSANVWLPEVAQQVKDKLKEPYIEAERLVLDYTKNKSIGEGITNVQLLIHFNDDLAATSSRIESLVTQLEEGLQEIMDNVPDEPVVQELKKIFDDCKKKLEADKQEIISIANKFTNVLEGSATKQSTSLGILVRR